MATEYLVVVSETDPVAVRVAALWGTPPADEGHVEGTPIRRLAPGVGLLKRGVRHVHDERLDLRLPAPLRADAPTLVFPSIHRSEQSVACLTVHPLGNAGDTADVGGRPRTLVPTDPPRMAAALRALAEGAPGAGVPATYEATHHGPELALPGFFVEIGFGKRSEPSAEAVRLLARILPALTVTTGDRVAVGVGGGHYAPRFTELALRRRWAFGHLISRHALVGLDRDTARSALARTPGAEGILYVRSEDAGHPSFEGLAARLREKEAPRRGDGAEAPTGDAPPASGT